MTSARRPCGGARGPRSWPRAGRRRAPGGALGGGARRARARAARNLGGRGWWRRAGGAGEGGPPGAGGGPPGAGVRGERPPAEAEAVTADALDLYERRGNEVAGQRAAALAQRKRVG